MDGAQNLTWCLDGRLKEIGAYGITLLRGTITAERLGNVVSGPAVTALPLQVSREGLCSIPACRQAQEPELALE